MEELTMRDDYLDKSYTEVLAKIAVLETKFENYLKLSALAQASVMQNIDNVKQSLDELKQGLGIRTEQHGKDIAVLQEQSKETGRKIDILESSRTWLAVAIIGGFISSLWYFITGKHS